MRVGGVGRCPTSVCVCVYIYFFYFNFKFFFQIALMKSSTVRQEILKGYFSTEGYEEEI